MEVALLAYDGLCTFEFGIMVELFGVPRPEFGHWYNLRVAGLERGPMRACGGVTVQAPHSLRVLDRAGTIIIPGWRSLDAPVPPVLLGKLRRAHDQNARILSVCSGAFVLAASGILDGKRATSHWKYAELLAERFPNIHIDPNVLYVDEGNVLTSAGSAAGIDMGLHLIRRDFGTDIANLVARRLVVPPHRNGGQRQFIVTPVGSDDNAFARVLDDLRSELQREQSVHSMARRAKMSPRTFSRRFKESTGMTPYQWVQHERVRRAQSLLETTKHTVDEIAHQSGFADAQLLRTHFKRFVGTSPTAYRRTFCFESSNPTQVERTQ